jgi:LDH2 family malate/lactate/ureidoglycolate dehydrogenase
MIYFDWQKCEQLMQQNLLDRGVDEFASSHVTKSLVMTSLRGVDSHGINLFPHYIRALESGRINPHPRLEISRTAASTAVIDADHAFGHHSGSVAISEAMNMASESGIGAVAIGNSSHFGAAAYFAIQAANQGYVGFAFTNADALVKAHAAKSSFFGTNPICFTAPLAVEDPLCLDMATSLVSWNKVINYRNQGKNLPLNWAFDQDGVSVADPSLAVSLNPAGSYKGFGLGMMVDILCALLSGGLVSKDILPMYTSPLNIQRRVSHFFMAINIEKFTELTTFKDSLQSLVDRVRALEPIDKNTCVQVPGDPEKKMFKERSLSGIPIEPSKLEEFLLIDNDFINAVRP